MKQLIYLGVVGVFLNSVGLPSAEAKSRAERLIEEKACLNCHKPNSSLHAPRLHGADKGYLRKQLQAFKEQRRGNVFMISVAAGLKDKDMDALAAYFSKFDPCDVDMSQNLMGKGDPKRGKPKAAVCIACHKANSPMGAPIIDGQNSFYLASQLKDIKYGRRQNPFMNALTQQLSEQEIWDVSAYFGSLNKCKKKGPKKKIPTKLVKWKLPQPFLIQLEAEAENQGMTAPDLVRRAVRAYLSGN